MESCLRPDQCSEEMDAKITSPHCHSFMAAFALGQGPGSGIGDVMSDE